MDSTRSGIECAHTTELPATKMGGAAAEAATMVCPAAMKATAAMAPAASSRTSVCRDRHQSRENAKESNNPVLNLDMAPSAAI